MIINIIKTKLATLEQIREFRAGTSEVAFTIPAEEPRLRVLPGYIRVDTAHQGDQDRMKGTYHVNAVLSPRSGEPVASLERISEAQMLPVIARLLEGFPFEVHGFHSDSSSEYVKHDIVRLLEKPRMEFTKSRRRPDQ
jgi:hypothetical protein